MKYQLYSKNLEITKQIKDFLDKKLEKIGKFAKKYLNMSVDLSRDPKHQTGQVFRTEINLEIPGEELLRVVENDFELEASIDKARDTLIRQLTKVKDKKISRKKIVKEI